jgi:quinol monooxygenase YgiN
MNLCVYVYYRVDPGHLEAARAAVRRVLAEMQAGACPRARLLTSVEDPLLWMEAYEDVADRESFVQALAAAARRHGLEAFLAAGQRRNTEVFVPACA